ncbi:MAG: hypothetical protein AAFX44_19700 [Pseudomonadota bacterium]
MAQKKFIAIGLMLGLSTAQATIIDLAIDVRSLAVSAEPDTIIGLPSWNAGAFAIAPIDAMLSPDADMGSPISVNVQFVNGALLLSDDLGTRNSTGVSLGLSGPSNQSAQLGFDGRASGQATFSEGDLTAAIEGSSLFETLFVGAGPIEYIGNTALVSGFRLDFTVSLRPGAEARSYTFDTIEIFGFADAIDVQVVPLPMPLMLLLAGFAAIQTARARALTRIHGCAHH